MSAVSQSSRAILVSKPEPMVTEATENIQVVVDDRERRSGIVEELEKAAGVAVRIERLALGDYCVDGAVLIEGKTAAGFAQSLFDGRLFDQAGRMATSRSGCAPAPSFACPDPVCAWPPRRSNAQLDRKSTRLNSSHLKLSRMPSSA